MTQRLELRSPLGKKSDGGTTNHRVVGVLTRVNEKAWSLSGSVTIAGRGFLSKSKGVPIAECPIKTRSDSVAEAKSMAVAVLEEAVAKCLNIAVEDVWISEIYPNSNPWVDISD